MTLELRDICLRFSHKLVLQKLCLKFEEGQLHALLGQNGAGKSTAANIICGELQADSGQILLDGQEVKLRTPKDAIKKGISYVHQRPMLADYITVRENLLLGLNKEQKNRLEALAQKWLAGIKLNAFAKDYGADIRFFIALTSALIKEPGILILDEPSALLDQKQESFLFQNLRRLAQGGTNIIIITHDYEEARKYCDTIDYLEEGRLVEMSGVGKLDLVAPRQAQGPRLAQDKLAQGTQKRLSYKGQDFFVNKGQITLIKGLAEDGLDQLEEELMTLRQKPEQLAFIPTDRKFTGSNPNLTIEQMLTAALDLPQKLKPALALQMIRLSGVDIRPEEKCSCLSGGMLQKLMLEREFYNNPDFLILCNPLQGLDPQTCQKICDRVRQAAADGAYVLVLSYGAFPSEFCDKEYRLFKGRLEAL